MSLRLRTAVIGVVVAALAAVSASAASYVYFAHRLEQNLNESLKIVSTFFIDEVRRSPFADPVTGQDLGRFSVQAIDKGGKRLPVSGVELPVSGRDLEVALGRVGFDVADVDVNGDSWRVRTTSTRYGAIQVALRVDEATAALTALRWITVLIGLAAAAFAGVVSFIVTRRALAPLAELTGAVERVARGNLDVLVSSRGGSSEVQRLASSFNTTITALQRSRAEQQRLVQDAGHDLRTPLTGILNNVAVLRRHHLDPAEAQLVLADLDSDARGLKRLIDEIVDVASGVNPAEVFDTVDISELVQDVCSRFARRHDRTIDVRVAAAASAAVQPQAIERAVANVLGNAVKYSTGAIEVSVRPDDQVIWIEVADRGIGLDGVDPAMLFERFWRADAARTSSGSGLGLAIVKDVAERHGGGVVARQRAGGGAVIGFSVKH